MNTSQLKKYAQFARRSLREQVENKLNHVLQTNSQASRLYPKAITELKAQIKAHSKDQIIESVAYTWFNRFCALRFMDVNGYNKMAVVSPVQGQTQPEILAEAKARYVDETIINSQNKQQIFGLLNGNIKSHDPQSEAYRILIVAVCNNYHKIMPYLFERITDYTELLMPDDLLSQNSILEHTRQAMSKENCASVESIGWLYQYYISEKKDEVFAGLKKNIKVTPENIPAATQLFTPHWIVRYLVENSLGRLWMLNNPDSKVIEQMDYYIKPAQENDEQDFLKIQSPEDLKICDPACGSGHMLTYAYDLLYAIYLDQGYDSSEIPEKILSNNLYGIEIDERAAELAAFALTMKAVKGNPYDESNNRRRFFRNPIKPNICRLQNITFNQETLNEYFDFVGRDLFSAEVRETLQQFTEADNFGSLIQPKLTQVDKLKAELTSKDVSNQLFLKPIHTDVLTVLEQTDYLSPKYHVVIANPPYMGGKGMNGRLGAWLKENYPDVKSDLFSAFMVRVTNLTITKGEMGFVTPYVWMFLSSYEKLRQYLLNKVTVTSLIQLEYNAFAPACIPVATFTLSNHKLLDYMGGFVRLSEFKGSENQSPKALEAIHDSSCDWFYLASLNDFKKIPGSPLAYWINDSIRDHFHDLPPLSELGNAAQGLSTADNDRFLRLWFEVTSKRFSTLNNITTQKWYPFNKGGPFRKWYGNVFYIINWENDGEELKEMQPKSVIRNPSFYFHEGLTWSDITSSTLSARFLSSGCVFGDVGPSFFPHEKNDLEEVLAYLNSPIAASLVNVINPSMHFQVGSFGKLPFKTLSDARIKDNVSEAIRITKQDWNSSEVSWDYLKPRLFSFNDDQTKVKVAYTNLLDLWHSDIDNLQKIEEKNNDILIDAYGLQKEFTSEVELKEITLTCNPHYRYKGDKTDAELEALLLADTMREFISYAVGCMFGRYSLDKEGLILANQGDTLKDYLSQVPKPSFTPDDDNVIPLIDLELERGKQESWFEDDISERFRVFLKVTFGTEHYAENLRFIEQAIGKDIKKFFVKDFYKDHTKRYKKRPIYWLFSSPKGSFNALIYMHRYNPDTISIILNDYLREFRSKLLAKKDNQQQLEISATSSKSEKTQAIKTIMKINKVIEEVNDYEREILFPLAGQKIQIDLDDGVKNNYPLFGKALKKVVGLS